MNWNHRSIRAKFGIAIGAVAALSVLLVTVVQTVHEHDNLKERAISDSRFAANLVGVQVGEVLVKTMTELSVLAADPVLIEQLKADDVKAMDKRLEAMGVADPDLTAVVVIDTQPRVRAISLTDKRLLDADYSDQLHVQIVLRDGVPGVGTPRKGLITGLPIVPIGVPIRSPEGELLGVLQGSLSLQKLTAQLENVRLGQQGGVTLYAGDGTILAHTEKSRILTPSSRENQAVVNALTGESSALETLNERGQPVFAAAVPVLPGGWVASAKIPVDEALTPLRDRLQRAVLIGLVVILAAVVLGHIFAQVLTAPIGRLRSAARLMAMEQYVPGSLAIRSGDELEELADDFEQMVLKINESEERYRTVSELTSDFAYAFDVTADRELVPAWETDALSRITGYSIGELAAKGGWYGIVHPDHREIAERRRSVMYAGHTDVSEFCIITKHGEERILRVHVRPEWNAELGRVTKVFGAAQDITETQRLEAQLREQSQLAETTAFLNNVLESSTEYAIIALSLDKLTLVWNEGARRLFGFTSEEMIGSEKAAGLFCADPDSLSQVEALFAEAYRSGSAEGTFGHYSKHIGLFTTSTSVTLRRDASGMPVGYLVISKDITDQQVLEGRLKRKNQELEQQYHQLQEYQRREEAARASELRRKRQHVRGEALRALGQMAGGIAHDLNQSLGLISGYSDIARQAADRTPPDVDALKAALPVIRTAALGGGETVKRLLSWTRLRPEDESQIFDLGAVLRDVADLTAPRWRDATQLEGRPISLHVEVEGDTTVTGRESAIREVLTNLIFNAVDAMPQGGLIRLCARRVDREVEVLVVDSGMGMPPDVQARIFDPFFTTKGDHGTGLGLAQVRSIVEDHGGSIMVSSTPGKGTVMGIRLPAPQAETTKAEEQAWSAQSEPEEVHIKSNLRILTVDDEPAMTMMVQAMLTGSGHSVARAHSAEEALDTMRSESFDLVISDMGMGAGMNGWQLAEHVSQSFPSTRFMLATGWGAQIDQESAVEKGVDAVIAKPYSMDSLVAAVRQATAVAVR